MTNKKDGVDIKPSNAISPFHLDAVRAPRGMTLIFDGIIGLEGFSLEGVELRSHAGRIYVSGKRLKVSVFENRAVEVTGRVEEIRFGYGKN